MIDPQSLIPKIEKLAEKQSDAQQRQVAALLCIAATLAKYLGEEQRVAAAVELRSLSGDAKTKQLYQRAAELLDVFVPSAIVEHEQPADDVEDPEWLAEEAAREAEAEDARREAEAAT